LAAAARPFAQALQKLQFDQVEPYFSFDLAISYLIIGLFVELISRVMDMGGQLQEYQDQIV